MGKQVDMNGTGEDHKDHEDWMIAKEWCVQHYGGKIYLPMIKHFMKVIEGLKEDARPQNNGKRATTQQVLDYVLCDTFEDLLEAAKNQTPEFTVEEWNNLYKAAAYEIYRQNQRKMIHTGKPKKKRKR